MLMSPSFISFLTHLNKKYLLWLGGGIGIHEGLKNPWAQAHEGSIPSLATFTFQSQQSIRRNFEIN